MAWNGLRDITQFTDVVGSGCVKHITEFGEVAEKGIFRLCGSDFS